MLDIMMHNKWNQPEQILTTIQSALLEIDMNFQQIFDNALCWLQAAIFIGRKSAHA